MQIQKQYVYLSGKIFTIMPKVLIYITAKIIWHQTLKTMFTPEGYFNITPKIKSISFPKRGYFQVALEDGRIIIMPVSAFPSLKKVPVKERQNYYFIGGGVSWDSCPEVIHIEQILGNFQNYAHEKTA